MTRREMPEEVARKIERLRTDAAEAAADDVNVIGIRREQFIEGFRWGTRHPTAAIIIKANHYWWERGAQRGQAAARIARSIIYGQEEEHDG